MKRPAKKHARFVTPIPEGLGPYETWLFGAGMDYGPVGIDMFSRRYLTGIAEFGAADRSSVMHHSGSRRSRHIWLPTLWEPRGQKDHCRLRHLPFVISKPAKFGQVGEKPRALDKRLREGVDRPQVVRLFGSASLGRPRFRIGLPVSSKAMKPRVRNQPAAPAWQHDRGLRERIGSEKRITVMAVIDDGIPFAHRNFRDETAQRTRIEFCWLQSAEADDGQASVLFGREYTRHDIEGYIAKFGRDEDELYREAGATHDSEGLASLLARHATHGGHVMDLATGYAPERGETAAEEVRIIAVQLPNLLTIDTSGIGKDMYLLSALHYILNRADCIADGYEEARLSLVINFSYGYFGGPHDGMFDIEGAITDLVQARRRTAGPTALVLPTGNSFLDRLHVSIPDAKFDGDCVRIPWRLQPNDRTPNYLEIWFAEGFKPVGYSVSITDAFGAEHRALRVGLARGDADRLVALHDEHGGQIGQMSVDVRNSRWRVLIATAPSEPHRPELPAVRAGLWTITIRRERTAERLQEPIRLWIQRDTDPISMRSGARQSYFDDPDNAVFDMRGALRETDTPRALVRRFGSLNGLATSEVVLAVAGFRLDPREQASNAAAVPARYSCAGTQNSGWPTARVSCSSLSDQTALLSGTVAAATRSGSRSILSGTSVAAPLVARRLVEAFSTASDEQVDRAECNNYLDLLPGERARFRSLRRDRLGQVLVPPYRKRNLF